MSHTPGPWFAIEDGVYSQPVFDASDIEEAFLCETGCHFDNARLMAAAPELLAALKGMLEVFCYGDEAFEYECGLVAVAAIEKATGYHHASMANSVGTDEAPVQ